MHGTIMSYLRNMCRAYTGTTNKYIASNPNCWSNAMQYIQIGPIMRHIIISTGPVL